jgi:hypothetical protein
MEIRTTGVAESGIAAPCCHRVKKINKRRLDGSSNVRKRFWWVRIIPPIK